VAGKGKRPPRRTPEDRSIDARKKEPPAPALRSSALEQAPEGARMVWDYEEMELRGVEVVRPFSPARPVDE